MKQNHLYLVCLCAVLGLSFTGCGEDTDNTGGCSPTTSEQDCGDPKVYYCDAISKSCVRYIPEHCLNGKADSGLETAQDCGGTCVSEAFYSDAQKLDYRKRCNIDQPCLVNEDCTSNICDGNVCKAKSCEDNTHCAADETCDTTTNLCVSCTDGKQNQDETDVDCGGRCTSIATPKRCALEQKCTVHNDCESGSCINNLCKQAEYKVADPTKLIINEVLDVSKSTPPFALNENVTACEFIEIANPDDDPYKLDGIKLVIVREDKEGLAEIDLSGTVIQGKSLIVIHNCDNLPLPEKVVGVKTDLLSITGSGTYNFSLVAGEKTGSPVQIKFSQYASSYNREIDFNANANMEKTTSIGKNAAAATPGYCLNGGLYHEGCVTHCENNKKDADESGIDCGGSLCEKCESAGECKDWKDCSGGYCFKDPKKGETDPKGVYHEPEYGTCKKCTEDTQCKQTNAVCMKEPILDANGDETGETNNFCAVPENCKDKVANQDETDTDCGGICGSTCKVGQICGSSTDCMSTICEDGKCAGTDPTKTDINALMINEIYDSSSAKTAPTFPLNRNNPSCEFIEIANISDNNVSLEGVKLVIKKKNQVENPTEIKLNGALDAKKILLVHSCKDNVLDYPQSDVRTLYNKSTLLSTKNIYNLYLEDEEHNTTYAVDFDATLKDYESSISHETDFDPSTPMKRTVLIDGYAAFATPGYCTNGGLFSMKCQNYCGDNTKNGNESDLDCGGNCTRCELGKSCVAKTDCKSGVCSGNICSKCTDNSMCEETGVCDTITGLCKQNESCTDKIKNQDETDVDCGGSCDPCVNGQKCLGNDDCVTGQCESGVCTGEVLPAGDPDTLVINEVFDSGAKSPAFSLNDNQKACEFIEIANPTNDAISLNGMTLELRQLDEFSFVKSTTSIPLTGLLPAKNLLIVNNCKAVQEASLPLPSDAISFDYGKDKLLTGTWTYDIAIVTNEKESVQIKGLSIGSVVNSSYNRSSDFDKSSQMQKTTNLMESDSSAFIAFATPGYCANGGTYSTGCKVECGNNGESCGGICAPCENGKKCSDGKDCVSGQCEGGKCTGEAIQTADYHKLFVNEVLFAPLSAGLEFNPVQKANNCKFIEILNLDATKPYDLKGMFLTIENLTDSTAAKTLIPLEGTIQANSAFVVFANKCDANIESQLPEGVNSMRSTKLDPGMKTNWGVSVDDGTEEANPTHNFIWEPISKGDGISQTHHPDRDVNSTIVKHNAEGVGAEGWNSSPGYCANGKLFKDNCL